jgi:hypothetical protein
LEDQGIDGRTGSECILGRLAGGCGVDPVSSGEELVAGCCDNSDEPAGYGTTDLVNDRLLTHS